MRQLKQIKVITLMAACLIAGAFNTSYAQTATVDELVQEVKQGLQYKRMIVVGKLAKKRNQEKALNALIDTMLRDKAKAVRRSAQRALVGFQDERIFEAIRDGVNDSDAKVRRAAVDALAVFHHPLAARLLVQTAGRYPKDSELVLIALESLREVIYRVEPESDIERDLVVLLDHKNKKIRMTTIVIMGILGRATTLEALMKHWPKASKRSKVHLADAFANIGHIAPNPLLVKALKSGDKTLVLHSLYALAQIQSATSLVSIWDLMKSETDARVIMACLYALIEMPDKRSIPEIMPLLDSEDPTVLHWSAYALGQLEATEAREKLEKQLSNPNSLVQASAAVALAEIGSIQSEIPLLKVLEKEQAVEEAQIAATKALLAIGSKKGSELFWKALEKPKLTTDVHLMYAVALANSNGRKYIEPLAKRLTSGSFNQRFVSAVALGVMGDERARPLLIDALEHGYPSIRRYAIVGLENVADKEAVRALGNTANDDRDPVVRILCAATLVKLGYPRFSVVLWNALDNKQEDIRSEAVIAIGRFMDNDVYRQLKWYLRREPAIPVRQTIHRLFREWKNEDF